MIINLLIFYLFYSKFTEETMGIKEVFYPGSKKGPNPEDDPKSFAGIK